MTAADLPPDRRHLAAMLRVFARSAAFFGHNARTDLLEYIEICEDTIAAQATMLRSDLTKFARHRATLADQAAEHAAQMQHLLADNAILRELIEEAIDAGAWHGDGEALNIVRQSLEQTR